MNGYRVTRKFTAGYECSKHIRGSPYVITDGGGLRNDGGIFTGGRMAPNRGRNRRPGDMELKRRSGSRYSGRAGKEGKDDGKVELKADMGKK
jgi:hypothetical protein